MPSCIKLSQLGSNHLIKKRITITPSDGVIVLRCFHSRNGSRSGGENNRHWKLVARTRYRDWDSALLAAKSFVLR